jgi:hypothetical protein
MRWRGPPDLAAPDTAISCSASEPLDQPPSQTPARSPSCPVPLASGVPPGWYPFSVVRAFLRPSSGAAQGVVADNFKIFWPSTNCPQSGGSYPPLSPDSPQEVHRWRPDSAGSTLAPAGRRARGRRAKIGQARWQEIGGLARRPAGPYARARPSRKRSVLARRSAGPDARTWPSPRGSARQTGDTPNCRHEFGQARRVSGSGRRSAGAHMRAGPHVTAQGEAAPREPHHGQGRRGDAARGTAPDKGRGPSTHEMEGPFRSSSAGHRYLMLSVRTTRSTTKPDTRLKSQLPSSPCVRGAPRMVPYSAVRDFYAYLVLPHKGFRPAISRFFGLPQTVHSSAQVIPLLTRFLHMKSTGEPETAVPGGPFGDPADADAVAAAVPVAVSPGAEPRKLTPHSCPAHSRPGNGGRSGGGRAGGGRAGGNWVS